MRGEVRVEISKWARKQLSKVPLHIARKLNMWVEAVKNDGIEEARKIPAYHDEPLHGHRKGQRSIRLSLGYRAIYEIHKGEINIIEVKEVSKHGY